MVDVFQVERFQRDLADVLQRLFQRRLRTEFYRTNSCEPVESDRGKSDSALLAGISQLRSSTDGSTVVATVVETNGVIEQDGRGVGEVRFNGFSGDFVQ